MKAVNELMLVQGMMMAASLGAALTDDDMVIELPRIPSPQEIDFFVHFDKKTLAIKSVSASNAVEDEDEEVLLIDNALALKFMEGTESAHSWNIIHVDGHYELQPKVKEFESVGNRVDVASSLLNVSVDRFYPSTFADVQIHVDKKKNLVEIWYDGQKIQDYGRPVKLYFTKDGDPSYLKCAFTLDVNILNTILKDNDLKKWPNPIKLRLDDVDDLAIYTVKGFLSVTATEQKHVKARNKRV